jgi:hypothetical protein
LYSETRLLSTNLSPDVPTLPYLSLDSCDHSVINRALRHIP